MKRYTLNDDQLDFIMDACKPVPMVALQCGEPRSAQENANAAWKKIGEDLGFDYMTVRPVPGERAAVFEAEPTKD